MQNGIFSQKLDKCTGLSGKVLLVLAGSNVMIEDCYVIQ